MSASRKKSPHSGGENNALLRLIAAVTLFLLCLGLTTCYPEETAAARTKLSALLSSSTDFHAAFSRLGARLEKGDNVAGAVGDWCVTVFAPTSVTVETPNSEPSDVESPS